MAHSRLALLFIVVIGLTGGCVSPQKKTAKTPTKPATIYIKEIRVAIRTTLLDIRNCYEKEMNKNESFSSGKIVMQWDIDEFGNAENVKIKKSTLPVVDECLAGVLGKAKFPPAPDNMISRVVYPFVFSSQ